METEKLRLFLDLARLGSFSRTAKQHYRTQPAVSLVLKKLEEELGLKLIERDSRNMRLTPEGEILKNPMAEVLRLTEELKFIASTLAKHPRGRVRIAAIHTVGFYGLGPTIKRFIHRYPDIRLQFQYDHSKRVYQIVEEKEADFGIVAHPLHTPDIEVYPLEPDRMVLITPPDRRWSGHQSKRVEQLSGERFVAFSEQAPTRTAIDEVFQKKGVQVEIAFEDDNIEMIKKAVELGMGVSIVPENSVRADARAGHLRLFPLIGFPLRPIGMIKLKRRALSKAAELFVAGLRKR